MKGRPADLCNGDSATESPFDTIRVNVSEVQDVIVIEDDTSASSLVNMLRQRVHGGRGTASEVILKSPKGSDQSQPKKLSPTGKFCF